MSLPLSPTAGYGTVTGRIIRAAPDTSDIGNEPNLLATIGKVRFVADIPYVRIPSAAIAGGPAIMVPDPVECNVDSAGYLVNPGNASDRSVKLVATDNTANAPYNWDYIVQFQLDSGISIPNQRIQVPGNSTVDLAVVIATAHAPEVSVATAVSLATAAQTTADQALALAQAGGGGSGGLDAEGVRDTMAVALIGSGLVTVTPNDATDRITIASTATANAADSFLLARANHTGTQLSSTIVDLAETVQDVIGATIIAGSGVTSVYNDTAGTITITAAGVDVEAVRDTIGTALLGTGLITVTVNDAADTITIATTATTNSADSFLLNRANHTGTQTVSTISTLQTTLDNLQSQIDVLKSGKIEEVNWATGGAGWGTYSTVTTVTRQFSSTNDIAATSPTFYSAHDKWYAHKDAP